MNNPATHAEALRQKIADAYDQIANLRDLVPSGYQDKINILYALITEYEDALAKVVPPPASHDATALDIAAIRKFAAELNELTDEELIFAPINNASLLLKHLIRMIEIAESRGKQISKLEADLADYVDALTAANARAEAYKATHHYSDEYVDALHKELSRSEVSPLGDTRIADEVAAEYLEAHAGEDLLADLHAAIEDAAQDSIDLPEQPLSLTASQFGFIASVVTGSETPAPAPTVATKTTLTPARLRALEHVARCEKTGKLLLGAKGTELRALRALEEKDVVKFITEPYEPYRVGWTLTDLGRAALAADARHGGGS